MVSETSEEAGGSNPPVRSMKQKRDIQTLTKSEKKKAASLWRKGKRTIDIAVSLGLSKSRPNQGAIVKILVAEGVPVRREWTKKDRETVRRLFPTTAAKEIARLLVRPVRGVYNTAFKLGVHPLTVRGGFQKGVHNYPAGEFKKGCVPLNKGLKGWCAPGSEKGWFKKGGLPAGTLYNGAITVRVDTHPLTGQVRRYKWIRISKSKWEMLHVHIWKKHRDRIPKGHIVVFKDGDSMNVKLSNLRMISRIQHAHETQQKPGYIAARIEQMGTKGRGKMNRDRYNEILKHPELIEAKRRQLELARLLRSHES